jgi:hypothetical protein
MIPLRLVVDTNIIVSAALNPDGAESGFSSRGLLIGFVAADLIQGETEIGDDLLEGKALATLPEVLARGCDGPAIFFGQLVVFSVNHHLEQLHHVSNLSGTKLIEQLVGMLSVYSHSFCGESFHFDYCITCRMSCLSREPGLTAIDITPRVMKPSFEVDDEAKPKAWTVVSVL